MFTSDSFSIDVTVGSYQSMLRHNEHFTGHKDCPEKLRGYFCLWDISCLSRSFLVYGIGGAGKMDPIRVSAAGPKKPGPSAASSCTRAQRVSPCFLT
jgi:hypothetical protein